MPGTLYRLCKREDFPLPLFLFGSPPSLGLEFDAAKKNRRFGHYREKRE